MSSTTVQQTLTSTNNLHVPTSQVVLVYTEWNEDIINELVIGATAILKQYPQVEIIEIQVPGCVEIPFAIKTHFEKYKSSCYIALGCVIKGDTPHFDYVCQSVTQGITTLNTSISSPVIFGILTVNNIEQAYQRLGGSHGHKGKEAAIAGLKMLALKNKISAE